MRETLRLRRMLKAGGASLLVCLLLVMGQGRALGAGEPFPEPDALEPAVRFWMRVYVEVDTRSGLLHDDRHLGVVYETIEFGDAGTRARQQRVEDRKRHWREVLARLAQGAAPRTPTERRVVQDLERALGHDPTSRDFQRAARRLRFQLGQRDRFREGLIRSGAYEERIHDIFRRMGLPQDLAHLPHVESSFNTNAYSKYGAAGMWQFMRSTGKLYLDIDYVVDERLDPIASTWGAARLLRDNYARLGTWPLAITAYNHGAAGMERAVRALGTRDIAAIVERYKSRTFGFASRNFYAQLLAARRVAHNYRAHFGELERHRPEAVATLELPFYADIADLERYLGISRRVIARYNPALRPPVLRSDKRIPKGYRLRLPADAAPGGAESWLAALPPERRYREQVRSRFHTVRRGETLSHIARAHGTSVSTIVALNGLRSAHRIYPGQRLELLAAGGSASGAARGEVRRHRVARGETLSGIAARYGTTIAELAALNDLRRRDRIYAGQVLAVRGRERAVATADVDAREHEVRRGDTLIAIAERYDTTVDALAALNDLENQRWLRPGQVLKLRAEADTAPAGEDGGEPQAAPGGGAGQVADARAARAGERGPDAPAPDARAADGALMAEAASGTEAALAEVGAKAAGSLGLPRRAPDSRWRRIDGDSIVVDAGETLGHYAHWLEIRTQRLRDLNGLRFGRPVHIGQRLRLDFSRVSPERFLARRVAYHRALEEDFLGAYRVTGTRNHTLRRGENLWRLSNHVYEVPPWLLQRYNPDMDMTQLQPGTELVIPVVESTNPS